MAQCSCGKECTVFVYSCSGIADTGELADKVCRNMVKKEYADGNCLSGVGAGISGFIQSAIAADKNIVIDGCPVQCAKKIMLKNAPEAKLECHVLTEYGIKKGSTEITAELVEKMTENIFLNQNKNLMA